MSTPLISIIVPVYNVSRYIERCARSLFEQSLNDIEYIFVDDCSPDNSIEILQQVLTAYPNRNSQVKIVSHDVNKGLATARNTGIRIAKGEYVAHCDSDDWVETNMYEKMYNAAQKENAEIVACDFTMRFKDRDEVWEAVNPMPDDIHLLRSYISCGWTVIWNMLVKRTLYYENNIMSYDGLNFGEDYGLSVRLLALSNGYVRVPEPLYNYNRTNVNSIVANANDSQNLIRVTNQLVEIYSKVNLFFKDRNQYKELENVLSWRMLSGKRGWLFQEDKWNDYLELYPESNQYIDSNPFCSRKDKLCQKIVLKPNLHWVLRAIKALDYIVKMIKK